MYKKKNSNRFLKRKTINKHIVKNKRITVKIKEAKQTNPLHHRNIYFQDEFNKLRREE